MRSSDTRRSLHSRLLVPALLIALLAGCSSAPQPVSRVTDVREEAARNIDFGNRYFNRAQYENADRFFREALRLYQSVDNRAGVGRALNSLGTLALATGRPERAESFHSQALQIAEDSDDRVLELQTLTLLGELELSKGNTEAAMDRFARALQISEAVDSPEDAAVLYHNLGTAQSRIGDLDLAEEYLLRAQEINERLVRFGELASNYFMRATVAGRREHFEEARRLLLQALELDQQMENSLGIAADLQALGSVSERLGETAAAISYYERGLAVAVAIGSVDRSTELLTRLVAAARRIGDQTRAESYARELEAIEGAM